jgi:signal transduction histidine kinase
MLTQLELTEGHGGFEGLDTAVNETISRRVAEERLRIARELHDVIASTFATISVHAGVAAHVLGERPDQATEALRVIKDASSEALGEFRAIFGLLRDGDDCGDEPVSRLDRVDALADKTTQAGVQTRAIIVGTRRTLPTAVDQAAYRIVQESLTNVLRHAGSASARVWLEYDRDGLSVEVEDDGTRQADGAGNAPAARGYGVVGMRERAAGVGGVLEAGPRPEGGFSVRAFLPAPTS